MQNLKIQSFTNIRLNKKMMKWFYLIMTVLINETWGFTIQVLSPLPALNGNSVIYNQSILQKQFDDDTYNSRITCTSGLLSILQFYKTNQNAQIVFKYSEFQLNSDNIQIQTSYDLPKPTLSAIYPDNQTFVLNSGCLGNLTDKNNYYNKVNIFISTIQYGNPSGEKYGQQTKTYEFSFLLGCDRGGRNKSFQFGYFLIALINAAITIGVALHSRIWSLRFHRKPLSIELKWYRYFIIIIVVVVLGIVYYIQAQGQFKNANNAARYVGLCLAYIFCFICADQFFYLFRIFKTKVIKFVRVCDLLSFVISTGMFILGFWHDSWMYYDVLAIAICVGAIKLLRFSTMKQAYISMLINVVTVSTLAIILHFILQRSYNDYASELNSPLFVMIPDLVNQLYKKCSWLPVLDIIVPGVFLSFLRTYDQNYNTGWGGVYTVIGNISFVFSTLLWVILEAVYPYSVPFSLVTYVILAFSIWIISRKRNQFETLWQGRFNGANNELSMHFLHIQSTQSGQSNRQSFSKLVGQDMINAIKIDSNLNNEDEYSVIERDNSNITGKHTV